jgi:FixJ family two-component response regulator
MAEQLTPRQYQVFVLNYLEGMPQVEIARELGISASCVSRHMIWAKEKMRRAMGCEFAPSCEDIEEPLIFPSAPYPVELPGCIHPRYPT